MKGLASVVKTSDDPVLQKVETQNLYKNIEGTMTFMDEFTKQGLNKREHLLKEYYDKLIEKIKLTTYSPFQESYFFDLKSNYIVVDGLNAIGIASNWEIANSDTENHANALR